MRARALREAFERRTAAVAVVGLGRVGLPLAVTLARAGFSVTGLDSDPARAAGVAAGRSPVEDVEPADLEAARAAGGLTATTDAGALGAADAVLIAVPTPLGKSREPDLSAVVAATDAVAAQVRAGQLVVLESTTYPGTTEEILLPRLTRGGLQVGEDLFLAFSPERLDPGNRDWPLGAIPKVVGGITPACLEVASALYAQIVPRVVPVSSARAAEMVKLLENTFRAVNVGLVNELALVCRRLGLDVWEVIGAAASKPFGFMRFDPGPGIGGHCLPSDPAYLVWRARRAGHEPRLIALADEINAAMPGHVVALAGDALNEAGRPLRGARVLALGVAYKAGVGDVRDSPAVAVVEGLLARGARVDYADPRVPWLEAGGGKLAALPWEGVDLGAYDLVVVLTAHPEFAPARIVGEARLVLDTRNATAPAGRHPHVRAL